MKKTPDTRREERSRSILERLHQQTDKTFGAIPPAKEEERDWTERWGRRFGLLLGYGLALYLLWQLIGNYVLK